MSSVEQKVIEKSTQVDQLFKSVGHTQEETTAQWNDGGDPSFDKWVDTPDRH